MRDKKVIYAPVFVSVIMVLLLISDNIIDTAVLNGTDYYLSLAVVNLIVYMLPLAFYCKVQNVMFFKALKFNLFSYRNLLLTICLALMFLLGLLMFIALDLYYFNGSIYASHIKPYAFNSSGEHVYAVLALIVVPALVKELLFRGVVLNDYRSYGIVWSIIMSTLLFSLASMSFVELPKLLYVGLFFGIIGAVTDSVIPSFVLHMIYNIFDIYIEDTVVTYIKKISDSAMPLFVLGVLLLFTLFCTFSVLESIYRKKSYKCDDENEVIKKLAALESKNAEKKNNQPKTSPSSSFSELILSPSFLTATGIFIVTAIINIL